MYQRGLDRKKERARGAGYHTEKHSFFDFIFKRFSCFNDALKDTGKTQKRFYIFPNTFTYIKKQTKKTIKEAL